MAITPGFVPTEAETFVAMCSNLEGAPPPPLQQPPIPDNWSLMYDSQSIGPFDNRWQLWQDTSGTGNYAVVIRGTVDQTGSIIEDLLAVMVPATGSISVDGITLGYQFAADPLAALHVGFALGTLITLYDPTAGILAHLITKVPSGAGVFVVGHSQGAAMATLCRSFLNYTTLLSDVGLTYSYKTYAFAQPKPGNDHYGDDYEAIAGNAGTAFTVNNDQDWVPQVPFTFELYRDINVPNVLSVLGSQPTQGVAAIHEAVSRYHHEQSSKALVRQKPVIDRLGRAVRDSRLARTGAAASTTTDITIVPTLNFVGCGSAITLQGTPGDNPDDPSDGWWQHHAALYYLLLQKQFPANAR